VEITDGVNDFIIIYWLLGGQTDRRTGKICNAAYSHWRHNNVSLSMYFCTDAAQCSSV